MNKLTKDEFEMLYSEDTTMGDFKRLREKARERMDYVKEFIQDYYVDSDEYHDILIDYDNSQKIQLEQNYREFADGYFDPEEYPSNVIFADANNTEEQFYPNKFELITITPYQIVVSTKILYTDFEQEIFDWIKANGNVGHLKKLERESLDVEYRNDYNYIMELLGPAYCQCVKIIDKDNWMLWRERMKSVDNIEVVSYNSK